MRRFLDRRFYLTLVFTATTTVAFFMDKLTGQEYLLAMGSLLAMYKFWPKGKCNDDSDS